MVHSIRKIFRVLFKSILIKVCINPNSNEPKVYGIVSWGFECGFPSFYAKTSAVIDWFDDVITGKYPPDPCDGGVCQMPDDIVSPGNQWFSNDLTDNDTVRKRREDIVFEDGEIARDGSWPWVVGIKGNPKPDYCHVKVVSTDTFCNDDSGDMSHAKYEDLIDIDDTKESTEQIATNIYSFIHIESDPLHFLCGKARNGSLLILTRLYFTNYNNLY